MSTKTLKHLDSLTQELNNKLALIEKAKGWLLEKKDNDIHFLSLTFNGNFISDFFVYPENSTEWNDVDQLVFEISNLIDACINFKKSS